MNEFSFKNVFGKVLLWLLIVTCYYSSCCQAADVEFQLAVAVRGDKTQAQLFVENVTCQNDLCVDIWVYVVDENVTCTVDDSDLQGNAVTAVPLRCALPVRVVNSADDGVDVGLHDPLESPLGSVHVGITVDAVVQRDNKIPLCGMKFVQATFPVAVADVGIVTASNTNLTKALQEVFYTNQTLGTWAGGMIQATIDSTTTASPCGPSTPSPTPCKINLFLDFDTCMGGVTQFDDDLPCQSIEQLYNQAVTCHDQAPFMESNCLSGPTTILDGCPSSLKRKCPDPCSKFTNTSCSTNPTIILGLLLFRLLLSTNLLA